MMNIVIKITEAKDKEETMGLEILVLDKDMKPFKNSEYEDIKKKGVGPHMMVLSGILLNEIHKAIAETHVQFDKLRSGKDAVDILSKIKSEMITNRLGKDE